MERAKPPGQWSDGVREPRVELSPEPNRDLLTKGDNRRHDDPTQDLRAAQSQAGTAADKALSAPVQSGRSESSHKHPRLKNRSTEPQPSQADTESSEP